MPLLPITYLGNILYYAHLISQPCIIDIHSHYIRQTYTNRTTIISSCGIQSLSIPVEYVEGKTPIADIRISTHNHWQQQHFRSLETAYRSTPFYQYFRDELACFYSNKWDNLVDFDLGIQNFILEALGFDNITYSLSDHYITPQTSSINDYREVINPKKFDVSLYRYLLQPYYQVFSAKYGFTPNLSVVDLLFNMGNEARLYLLDISKQLNK